jgi:predicted hydrocarbon binding protein
MSVLQDQRTRLDDHDFDFVGDCPVVRHSHHYNLYFDQTIDDALGRDRGHSVRTRAAHEASYRMLRGLFKNLPPTAPEERISLASELFSAMGHGRFELDVNDGGGHARAPALHYGVAWNAKYGRKLKRHSPADAFTAGYLAATAELAFSLSAGELSCQQTECIAMGAREARFELKRSGTRFDPKGIDREKVATVAPAAIGGVDEQRIARHAHGLSEVLDALRVDDRGLVGDFRVMLTVHPADYYTHLSSRMLDIALTEKPQALDAARDLLREAGRVCSYHTFGGIMSSPEWEEIAGPPPTAHDVIVGGLSAARAMGYGRWTLESYVPEENLVLRSSGTSESVFGRLMAVDNETPCSYHFQGAALALMDLAHRVTWQPAPAISATAYLEMRRDERWNCRQTHCLARSDAMDRVVLTRK